jgi:carboxylesterase type B
VQVNGSEDCLYLGLYSRPWTKGQPLKPVVVTFYGGGFIQGSAYFTLPPSAYPILNVSSASDLMFIYPNYRTNAFGFLAGREVAADPLSDANAGLLDQEAVLRWTKRYVSEFGGDPDDVSVWGQSAGGGSVVAQVIARDGGNGYARGGRGLIRKALASSPFWPKTYRWDSDEVKWIYDTVANRTGCAGPNSLACLKRLDVQTIRDASLYVAGSHTYNTSSYTWGPVIDGKFLTAPLSEAAKTGKVNIEVGFGMYNSHEGENFTPGGLGSEAAFSAWLAGFLPRFGKCDLAGVKKLYPPSGATETLAYNTSGVRAGLIYRDVVLACPAYWMAGAAPKGSWLGEYTISPAKHASDTYWVS